MNKGFNLTSKDYADLLGITTDTLRKRRRRGTETNYIQDEKGNYWWQRSRPSQDKSPVNVRSRNGLYRVPGAKKIDTKKRNRGALARGDKSDYPNWRFEEANKIKALAKIRDGLGDDVVDEITPELFKLAKKRVQDRKQKDLDKQINKSIDHGPHISGLDKTPIKYGTMLNQTGFKNISSDKSRKDLAKWKYETDVKFIDKPGHKIPDFYSSRPRSYNYYEVGNTQDDRVEVPGVYEGVDYSTERTFKNKIEEDIWRLKNKK